jgi:hypothetical protein
LLVAAGGASGWIKNTQRPRAGNIRMREDLRAVRRVRESPTKLLQNYVGKLLTCRVYSRLRELYGRYRKKPYRRFE